jgi:hypothetical protein
MVAHHFVGIPFKTKKVLAAMMGMIENGLISKEFISIQSVYLFNPATFLTLA